MRMRLQAMQQVHNINNEISFQWFQDNIYKVSFIFSSHISFQIQVASYFRELKDEDKVIICMETVITRSAEFGKDASSQHEKLIGFHNVFLFLLFPSGVLLDKGRYLQDSRSILAVVNGIRIIHTNGEMEKQSAVEVTFIRCCFLCCSLGALYWWSLFCASLSTSGRRPVRCERRISVSYASSASCMLPWNEKERSC